MGGATQATSKGHLDSLRGINYYEIEIQIRPSYKSETYMFDEDAFPGIVLFCIRLSIWAEGGGRGHGQDHGCTDLHLDMEEVVPDVLEIHVLERKKHSIKNVSSFITTT